MLVGDAGLRSKTGQQKQLCHRCFSNKKQDPFGGAPCTGDDTFDLPKKQCGGGIRTTITFPTYVRILYILLLRLENGSSERWILTIH